MTLSPEAIEALAENQKPIVANLYRPAGKDNSESAPYAIIPKGMKLESLKPILDQYLVKPLRRKGTAIVHDVSSFVSLTQRYKSEASAIFFHGSITPAGIEAQLLSVLNYNPQGADNTVSDWGDHKIQYDFPVSADLKKWLDTNGERFDQKEFAMFLEDNCRDMVIADPDRFEEGFFGSMGSPKFATPSDIFMLSRGIEVRVNERVHSAYRHTDGTQNIQFTSEHEGADGKPLTIPEWFVIGIRIFEDGEIYQIPVRLRYRVDRGAIAWFFEIYRMNELFDIAFDQACNKAAADLGLPMFKGKPE